MIPRSSTGQLGGWLGQLRTPAHSSWRTSAFLSQQGSAAVSCPLALGLWQQLQLLRNPCPLDGM